MERQKTENKNSLIYIILLSVILVNLTNCGTRNSDIRDDLKDLVENGRPQMYYHWNSKRAEMFKSQADTALDENLKLRFQYLYWTELVNAGQTQEVIKLITNYLESEGGVDLDHLNRGSKPIFDLLAVAYLRLGEQQNCFVSHTSSSCIIPFDAEAIHSLVEGSQNAIRIYEMLINKFPYDYQSKWLIYIAHMTLGHDPSELPEEYHVKYPNWEIEQENFPYFRNIGKEINVNVNGLSGGVCIDDFNNDGYLDIFVTSYGMTHQAKLMINNKNGGFDDQTLQAGLQGITGGLNAVHADYDNDGDRDILVLRGGWLTEFGQHPNSLLRNNGDGTFEDVTYEAGLTSKFPTQTASWADFNNDGWLDLFIGNETFKENDVFCELYKNNGDGTFTEVAQSVGISVSTVAKGVAWGDINNDGWPDLYISSLGDANKLFRNDHGSFTDITISAGVQNPKFGFPCWFWDFNNDGLLDILVASYEMRTYSTVSAAFYNEIKNDNLFGDLLRLYRNNGDETFSEVSAETGLNKVMHAMGSNFGDLDNDGFPDFYIGTGAPNAMSIVPNRMFHNLNGESFEEVTSSGGFGHLQKGHAVSFADIDNDGDQDIYIVVGGAFEGDVFDNALFENPGFQNNWISIDLEGKESNRDGIGARITIEVKKDDSSRIFYAVVSTGGSFGASSLRQELGIGHYNEITALTINWPGGQVQRFQEIVPNRFYSIVEGESKLRLLEGTD